MNSSVVSEHLLISLVPWLAAVVVGGGLGYVCALAAHSLFSILPGLRGASMLLPWRTIAVTLPLLSPLVVVLVAMGALAGAMMVGLFVFLFALPFTVVALLEQWYPSPLVVRLIAGARTLATASVAVAAIGPPWAGGGGAGWLIYEGMRFRDNSQMLRGFSIVVLLALMIDILLGALQLAFSRISEKA